jgi:hypothetical protein
VPDRGTRVLVVTNNAKAKGDVLARALGEEVREKRGQWGPPLLTLDEAIDEACRTLLRRQRHDSRSGHSKDRQPACEQEERAGSGSRTKRAGLWPAEFGFRRCVWQRPSDDSAVACEPTHEVIGSGGERNGLGLRPDRPGDFARRSPIREG